MSHFELFIDDDNEIKFDVTIEGTSADSISSRLVLESTAGFEVGFDATKMSSNEIHFLIPNLKNVFTEGSTSARLEVFIDDRRFIPLDLIVNLKKSVKVEAVVKTTRVQKSPNVRAVLSETGKRTKYKKSKTLVKKTSATLDTLISEIEGK
jgi:hypothetical protein